ncbi:MAG: S1C family serine protease [Oscillospiraceae bacterium]
MYDSDNYTYSNGGFIPNDPDQKPPKKSGGAGKVIAGLLAVVLIGGASGYGGAYLARSNENVSASASVQTEAPVAFTQTTASDTNSGNTASALGTKPSTSGEMTTKDVINKVQPSVVLVSSSFTSAGGASTGTGIIFSADGYIVTNAHVITTEVKTSVSNNSKGYDPFSDFFDNFYNFGGSNYQTEVIKADKVTVTLNDETEYEAKIIGCDANTDLAVLKIEASGLTPAEIGDSSTLEMGDRAITLGYPLGLGLSASDGIISGLNKEMSVEVAGGTATMTLLQTDAAINPGNSGGPLLNSMGQVVGITSSKIASSSVDGVGFAIPITDALPILNELMTTGTVKNTTPKIGITGTEITAAVKRYYNLPVKSGVLVASVEPGSCAEAAGLEEGDVIIKADGQDISSMEELVKIKNKHKAGEKMTLTLARSDGNVDIELTLDAEE